MFDLARSRPGGRLGVARLHAQHAPPGVGGLARVGELLLPHARDLARELGARGHVLAAQDLVLVELHHAAVVAELGQQRRELVHHGLIARRQVVQLLQVGRGARLVVELLAPQLRAAREELADERAVEDLAERARERRLGAAGVADLLREPLERVERQRVDVGDERVAEPGEGLLEVVEIAVRHRRGAPQERAARAAAVARSLTAGRHRRAERAPQLLAARSARRPRARPPRGRSASRRSACRRARARRSRARGRPARCAAATCAARARASHAIGRAPCSARSGARRDRRRRRASRRARRGARAAPRPRPAARSSARPRRAAAPRAAAPRP